MLPATHPSPRQAGLCVLLLLLLLAPAPARGQGVEVAADAGVSHALPPPGLAGSSASYANGGLRVRLSGEGHLLFAGLSAGASLANQVGSWGWGTAGGELSGRLSPTLGWGVSATGSGFLVGDPTRYGAAVVRLRPELRLRLGDGLLVAGARGELGRSEVGTGPSAVRTDLWSTGGDVELRSAVAGSTLRVGAGGVEATTGTYGTAWLGVDRRVGPAWVRAELRGWRVPGNDWEATGSVRISLDLGRALSGWAAGGRSDPDPLLGTPPGDFVGSGISWRLVAPDPTAGLPARVLDSRAGRVAFTVQPGPAREVVVVGDFTRWEGVPLERVDGRWVAELTMEPGLYHYGFLVDGEWFVPDGAPGRIIDEWGRPTATLVVPGRDGDGDAREVRSVTCADAGSSHGRRVVGMGPQPSWTECRRWSA